MAKATHRREGLLGFMVAGPSWHRGMRASSRPRGQEQESESSHLELQSGNIEGEMEVDEAFYSKSSPSHSMLSSIRATLLNLPSCSTKPATNIQRPQAMGTVLI